MVRSCTLLPCFPYQFPVNPSKSALAVSELLALLRTFIRHHATSFLTLLVCTMYHVS